ncbi:MAG: hypothetical protein KKH97_03070 [Proteobacteria bacterium]|nr:hypothetical protein [Pseudomonadota bacterium]MBU1712352.1 hypothetical protein [Pseudomonadota bacterium]
MTSQMRRPTLSVPKNIAERYRRKTLESLNPRILDPFLPMDCYVFNRCA